MEAREKDDVGTNTGCFARMCTCWQALERAVMGNCWAKPGPTKSGSTDFSNSGGDLPDVTPRIALPTVDDSVRGQHLRVFTYQELRAATRNFRPDSLLGKS